MKIPREFERELFLFILSEIRTGEPLHDSVELADRCRRFCMRWYGAAEAGWFSAPGTVVEIVSWSERLGKHVGDFYFIHKEG